MEKWQDLQKQSRRNAKQYDLDPFDLGIAGSRLGAVKVAIDRWMQEVHSWKRNQEIIAKGLHIVRPVNHKMTSERKQMLKERYPMPGER